MKNKYTLIFESDDRKLTAEFDEVNCHEVIVRFREFLLGVSFYNNTITDSFEEVAEEYKETIK